MGILVENTPISEWYRLVCEARFRLDMHLDEHVESYLVLTLDEYTQDSGISKTILAFDFLESAQTAGRSGLHGLRKTGDRCLLLCGFFPERAQQFNVNVDYFMQIGQQAYEMVALRSRLVHDPDLFNKLSISFQSLTSLLLAMRQH